MVNQQTRIDLRSKKPRCFERGFSLIELMIAMVIGTMLLLGLTVLFSANSGNQNELEKSLRKLENIRYAMDTLGEDSMHAGFYSDFNPRSLAQGVTYQTPNPCALAPNAQGWDTSTSPVLMPVAIQGISKDDTTVSCLTNRQPGTAAIVIRRAETGSGTAVGAATTATNLYVQVSGCLADTNRILASPGPAGTFILRKSDCTTIASPVRRLIQRTYYVATCSVCSPSDGIPTLKRVEMVNGVLQIAAVAEGIEDLQIEYGIDDLLPINGQPDSYVSSAIFSAYTAADWANVVSIRLHLLSRTTQPTAGYSDNRTYQVGPDVSVAAPADGFKRTLLTTTVRLNNVAGRLE
jgi:type IV pilus assembly protein PilW